MRHVLSGKEPRAVLDHVREVRGVAADFPSSVLTVRALRPRHCAGQGLPGRCLGMDALVTILCSRNTNGIVVWAWTLCSPYALGTQPDYGFGMDAWTNGA